MRPVLLSSRRSRKKVLFFVITFVLCKVIFETKTGIDKSSDGAMVESQQFFLIPYLKGQGLNNQLWEYRTAAIIARATGRTLCLEPFHKFYLQKSGREFIPFEELFDVHFLNKYVKAIIGHHCAKVCNQTLHSFIELTDTSTNLKSKPFSIPDWRPGSLNKFQRSTGFVTVPTPTTLNINSKKGGIAFDSPSNIKDGFRQVAHRKCIAVSGPLLDLEHEFFLWTKFLRANKAISELKDFITSNILSGSSYLAIHWRLEESKCAGVGVGIGYGRGAKEHDGAKFRSNKIPKIIRRSDNKANLCFYSVVPRSSPTQVWFRLISKEAIVKWIKMIKSIYEIRNVYLATDLSDFSLLNWIKSKISITTKRDIKDILEKYKISSDNDVLSILEQEICADADVFAGTQMSSWTERVIEKRFINQSRVYKRNKFYLLPRPDSLNRTLYFDVEVCACELDSK